MQSGPASSSVTWDPTQYLKAGFDLLRLRPGLDLMAAVPLPAASTIYDLGCGTGTLTSLLAAKWPAAQVMGLDNSDTMLSKAGSDFPELKFQQADANHWSPPVPADLIYSNAVLQWLDDHGQLFPRLLSCLSPGGVLAIQMPRNHTAPSHQLMTELAREGSWREKLEPYLRPGPVAEAQAYYEMLADKCQSLSIWETEYLQVLEGDDPVKEWTKGTALRPLLAALDDNDAAAFEAEYAARLRAPYPKQADGKTLFPFRRIFIVAVK